jgi:hypothetical protein
MSRRRGCFTTDKIYQFLFSCFIFSTHFHFRLRKIINFFKYSHQCIFGAPTYVGTSSFFLKNAPRHLDSSINNREILQIWHKFSQGQIDNKIFLIRCPIRVIQRRSITPLSPFLYQKCLSKFETTSQNSRFS